jgi:hypothetical protein
MMPERKSGSAGSAAAGRVVETHVAAATLLQAAFERGAAGLQDCRAGLVAAGAGDAAAVSGLLALADAAREVALAKRQAVERAAAGAQSAGECLAQVLQRRAGDIVIAVAVDLEAAGALFDLQRAPWNHAPACRGSACGQTSRRGSHCGTPGRSDE